MIGRPPIFPQTCGGRGKRVTETRVRHGPTRRWMHRREKSKLIKGATGDWEVVIGMEVHAQVTSQAKLFSGASTEFGGEANSHVSLVDAAMPGMLPVINEECVRQAVRTGLGLNAKINLKSVFDRKNYFYPDLPQGYQISQYKSPIVGRGRSRRRPARRRHRAGRHRAAASRAGRRQITARPESHDVARRPQSVRRRADGDRQRSPICARPTRPRPSSPSCAAMLRYLGTCDGDMERAICAPTSTSRCASPARRSARAVRSRTSIRSASSARRSSTRRAGRSRSSRTAARSSRRRGCSIRMQGETRSMRTKEEAHDYRYFPDPDLLPLELVAGIRRRIAADACRSCRTRRRRAFMPNSACRANDAEVIVAERRTRAITLKRWRRRGPRDRSSPPTG